MRACLIRPSLPAGARPNSAGYTRIRVYRPVPYGYALIDLSLGAPVRFAHLYPLTLELVRDRAVIESIASNIGLRTIARRADGRILLNDQPASFMFGPLDQGYWPDGFLTPPHEDAIEFDLEYLKSIGCNLVGVHIKTRPARWYSKYSQTVDPGGSENWRRESPLISTFVPAAWAATYSMSMKTANAGTPPDPQTPIPGQIPFIIGNEGCERFSFYGMRNILTVFLVSSLLMHLPEADRAGAAKDVFHTFVIGVYFFPLLGGWLADRFWGKYQVIFWLSLVYCVGQLCLALFVDSRAGFYTGLALIALGSGGIKPCVSSFVGDQFDQTNKHRAKVVFDAFYWIINFGSFFASLLMPIFLKQLGPAIAFGIPGALMFISTVILWLGRQRYVMVPPAPPDPHSFLNVSRTALASGRPGFLLAVAGGVLAVASFLLVPSSGVVIAACTAMVAVIAFGGAGVWLQLEGARGRHPDEAVEGVRAVLRVLVLFALVTPFWSLFDQKASTWVLQADAMTKPTWFQSSQMQALNPLLVMLLIPFNNLVLFPALKRLGYELTALRRMTMGIAFSGLSWVVVGWMQVVLDGGQAFSIAWQVLPYALLTLGEVLVSATGLEFAYSQAPPAMKGVLMSFWLLSVTIGNLWVLVVNAGVKNATVTTFIRSTGFGVTAFQMFFFAAFAFVAALAFGLCARSYRVVDHYRKA